MVSLKEIKKGNSEEKNRKTKREETGNGETECEKRRENEEKER